MESSSMNVLTQLDGKTRILMHVPNGPNCIGGPLIHNVRYGDDHFRALVIV